MKVWMVSRTDRDDFSDDVIAVTISAEAARRFIAEQQENFQRTMGIPYGLKDEWEYDFYEVEVIE